MKEKTLISYPAFYAILGHKRKWTPIIEEIKLSFNKQAKHKYGHFILVCWGTSIAQKTMLFRT